MATGQKSSPAPAAPDDGSGPLYGQWQWVRNHPPYIPEWTDPEWSPNVEYSVTGMFKRDVNVDTGTILRPAIRPEDADKNPTDFARRFGIYPKAKPSDEDPAVGRSLITPTLDPSQVSADSWGEAESWQSYVFGGPTTKEIIEAGVYVPNYQFSGSVIEGDLHPFLARDRWIRPGDEFSKYIGNVRWRFGSSEGIYDVADDRLWEAMKPALRLAGRVLESNHPYWNANLSIYNVRPVPAELDGRPDEVRLEDGAPLPSLWLDENTPGMFPQAAELRQLGFRSRDTTLAILNQFLRFAIGSWENAPRAYAITTDQASLNPEEPRITIVISPRTVWQLIAPEFPEARVASTFFLANCILHELSHACRMAHMLLLRDTDFTLSSMKYYWNLGIRADMIARFRPLGDAMFGKHPDRSFVQDYFFQDCPQCEEGKCFEKELWGGTISLGQPLGYSEMTKLRPFIQHNSWPASHLAPDLQHLETNRSFYAPYAAGGYEGYLLDPPAPAYDQRRPVPVDSYAQFFRESWWQNDFRRFGHQALKFVPSRNSLMVMSNTRDVRLMGYALQAELSRDDYNYILREILAEALYLNEIIVVIKGLRRTSHAKDYSTDCLDSPGKEVDLGPRETCYDLRQHLLLSWLQMEVEDLVLYKTTWFRLNYESRTWIKTFRNINTRVDKSLADIDELSSAIGGWLADAAAGKLTADSEQTIRASFDRAATTIITDDLMESDRLFRYSIQYAQSLIAIYSLVPGEVERRVVHNKYMKPFRNHLTSARNKLLALVQKLKAYVDSVAGLNGQNFLTPLLQGLSSYISEMREAALVNGANLDHTIGLLAAELVAPGFDYSSHPKTLPFVPEARKRVSLVVILRKAAARPLAYLNASDLDRVTIALKKSSGIILKARERKVDNDDDDDEGDSMEEGDSPLHSQSSR